MYKNDGNSVAICYDLILWWGSEYSLEGVRQDTGMDTALTNHCAPLIVYW